MPDTDPTTDPCEAFDLEEVYDSEISPLMTQILDICKRHDLPMVATFLFQRLEDGSEGLCTSGIPGPEDRRSRTIQAARAIIERGVGDDESVRVGSGAFAITVEKEVADV